MKDDSIVSSMDLNSVLALSLNDLLHANRLFADIIRELKCTQPVNVCGSGEVTMTAPTTRDTAEEVNTLTERIRFQAEEIAELLHRGVGGEVCEKGCPDLPMPKAETRDPAPKPVNNKFCR